MIFTLFFVMCSTAFSQNEGFASTEYAEEPAEEGGDTMHLYCPVHGLVMAKEECDRWWCPVCGLKLGHADEEFSFYGGQQGGCHDTQGDERKATTVWSGS